MAVGTVEEEQPTPFKPPNRRQPENVGGAAVLAGDPIVVAGEEIAGTERRRLRIRERDVGRAGDRAEEVARFAP